MAVGAFRCESNHYTADVDVSPPELAELQNVGGDWRAT